MSKRTKIMSILYRGKHYECIFDTTKKYNMFILYEKWYCQGWHRKKLGEYADDVSVLLTIYQTAF